MKALEQFEIWLVAQFNRELPWSEIDMDFMNLNQSAHGDREFGYIATRPGLRRKTVAGHWQDAAVHERIATWARAACGWTEAQTLSVARFGDNMREVAVTEGDKVEAEIRFGFAANGYGVGDLAAVLPDAGCRSEFRHGVACRVRRAVSCDQKLGPGDAHLSSRHRACFLCDVLHVSSPVSCAGR
jgi:L-arabinose isomerase